MNSKSISPQDLQTLYNWAESKPFVKRLWVFGSRTRGDHKPDSDLDVAIEINAIRPSDSSPYVSFRFRHKGWVAEIEPDLCHRLHLCHYNAEVTESFNFDFNDASGVSTRMDQVSIAQEVNKDGILVYDYASDKSRKESLRDTTNLLKSLRWA